jgi:signal transduction histidine kinase
MLETRRFKANATAAGAFVTVLLAVGMMLAIEAFGGVTAEQLLHVRAQEQEITLAERLRWSGELIVSAGRGFLISGDPELLVRLQRARAEFDGELQALSDGGAHASESLLRGVERQAEKFIRTQETMATARSTNSDITALTLRFERELLPLQHALAESLDQLVQQKETMRDELYLQAEDERRRLQTILYAFLGASLLLALVATLHFGKRVGRAYEAERAAVDAARRAIVSRDDLMGMVAHDLRTPLQAIVLKALLLKRLAASSQLREQADSITRISHSMEHLIGTMLDVASIQAGRFALDPTVCPVKEILREALPMVEPLALTKQIQLKHRLATADLLVIADRERVLQVLANLVGNAVKFSPSASEVSLHIERQGEAVRFSISDQGPGILPEHLSNIFTRFWQRDPGAKMGTGLGLFIAKTIVDAHGGRIWAESEMARGSTFHFTLQRAELDEVPHQRLASTVAAHASHEPVREHEQHS